MDPCRRLTSPGPPTYTAGRRTGCRPGRSSTGLARALIGWLLVHRRFQVVAWVFDWPVALAPPVLLVDGVARRGASRGMPRWRYRVHRWELAADLLRADGAGWTREWRIAPVSRSPDRRHRTGPIGKLFGLTQGHRDHTSAAGALVIDGLDDRSPPVRQRGHRRRPAIQGRRHVTERPLLSGSRRPRPPSRPGRPAVAPARSRHAAGRAGPRGDQVHPLLIALIFAGRAGESGPPWG